MIKSVSANIKDILKRDIPLTGPIDKINKKNPVTFHVRGLNNEKTLGSFYTRELSPAKQNILKIEKVIKRTK